MGKEVWKPVAGFEGYYEISSIGRVRSVDRFVPRRSRNGGFYKFHVGSKLLPHKINSSGYPIVVLTKSGKSYWKRVHRLLAEAFIPNPLNLPEIDHIDNDKTNFDLANLRWVTHAQNMNNALTKINARDTVYNEKAIRKRVMTSKNGSAKNSPKTVYQYALDGTFLAEYISLTSASKAVGLVHESIRLAIDREGRTSGGYMWRTYRSEKIKPLRRG